MDILTQPAYGPFISRALAKQQGLRHYYTGNPCKYGHVCHKYTKTGQCPECLLARSQRPEIKQKLKERSQAEAFKAAKRAYCKKRYRKKNPVPRILHESGVHRKIAMNIRNRVNLAIGRQSKSASTMALLGCTISHLIAHLESLFQDGMSWQNHGRDGWHIDHIRPCASFDLADPEQQRQCFHYTNLQPLWAGDNLRKGSSTSSAK
jgi:hypothetical protein